MKKLITVKGLGKISAKPDLTILSLAIETIDRDFDRCVQLSGKYSETIREAVIQSGLARDALKTSAFEIDKEYHTEYTETRISKKVFEGWKCSHLLKAEFPHDAGQLAKTLHFVAASGVESAVEVDFSLSDTDGVISALLESAAKNARRKAETLCSALGAKLGELVKIDYDWGEISFFSKTSHQVMLGRNPTTAAPMKTPVIDPEEIRINDSATFVWKIG